MKARDDFFAYTLVALTLLSCFSPIFAYVCFADALVVVVDSLIAPKKYEPMITFTEALVGV